MFQTDSILATVSGVGTTVTLAQTVPADPGNPWSFLSYLPAIIGPALVVLINRQYRIKAARKKVLADEQDAEAKLLRSDNDPTNDGKAAQLEHEARLNRAEAEAMENRE